VLKAPTYFDRGTHGLLRSAGRQMKMRSVLTRIRLSNIRRRAASLLAAMTLTVACASVSTAQDLGSLKRDLASGNDFRLRVSAALALGRTHNRAAIAPLTNALDDTSPAVRAAAAAALGAIGQREAADAVRSHLASEPSPIVRAQLESTLVKLEVARRPNETGAKVLVKLGELKNLTGSRGDRLAATFRGATRAKAAALPGVEVLNESAEARNEAASRKLPVLLLDGVLNRLAQGAQGEQLMVSAQVEYVFRKMPEHALTGSVTGTARAMDSAATPGDATRVAQLEVQALEGAVESAMRGAPDVMSQALR
jgi:hypothetical protein